MIPFLVWHEGMDKEQARWVFAVDNDRFLLSGADGSFYWRPMADCTLKGCHTPEMPTLIAPHPATQKQVVLPSGLNGLPKLN